LYNKIVGRINILSGIEVLLLLIVGCSFLNTNPLDPNGKNYVPPSFTISSESDNLGDGDTIHRTWAKLALEGNRKECQFQIQINDGDTSLWQNSGEFLLKSLTDGTHSVLIKCKYNGGSAITTKRISFTVAADGFVPRFFSVINPLVRADSLETLILTVRVSGVMPITFTWYKDGEVINGQIQNFLEIERFTSEDVGEYYCVAANEYDSVKSPLFKVDLRTSFTITYDGNGNTSGTVPFDASSYSAGDIITVKGNVGNLGKVGYSFAGWSNQIDGGGITYSAGAEIQNVSKSITLYAKWSKTMTFAVLYNGNGATGDAPSDPNLYDSGTVIIVKGNVTNLKKENYTFVGWNTASDGNGKNYSPGVRLTIQNENIILYAKWTQRTICTIKYDGNGNTGGTVPVDSNNYEIGSVIVTKINSGKLTKSGFTFVGWNTRADGNGESYAAEGEMKAMDSVIILYANWTEKETFGITYNGNGNSSGDVPVDVNVYEKNASAVLKENVFGLTKPGYCFIGWCADKDGNGTQYAPRDTVLILGNTVMYAVWKQVITYKVTYQGNDNSGGTVPIDTVAYVSGSEVSVLPNSGILTRVGYVFAGWNTSSDGKGKQLYPGSSFKIDSMVILYARWTNETTYAVSYDANGSTSGVVPVDNNRYVGGEYAIASVNSGNLTKKGYSFAGWNTKTDGSGTTYKTGGKFAVTSNITLYAVWTLSTIYTITYNGNSNTAGTVPVDPNAYEAGNVAVVMGNTGNLTREGYTFTGWNEKADGSGSSHAPNSEFKLESQNVVLYAVWTKITVLTFTVTYDGNGNSAGNVPVDNTIYTTGMQATILTNSGALVKQGYTFAGWSRILSATSDSILMPRDIITMKENVKLFAVWTNKPLYKVVYNANGSSSGSEPIDDNSYLPGVNVTVKGNTGNLIKNGNTFVGWNTKRDGTGTTYTENTIFVKNGYDDTLYAKWSANPTYTITYMSNNATSGTVPVDANTYEAGVMVVLKTNSGNLSRNGYTFKGWNTKSDGTGIAFDAGVSVTMPPFNSVLYAEWQLIPTYSVTYNGNGNTSGSVPVDPARYASSATVAVKGNTGGLVKTNMNFSGWNTKIDGTGTSYAAGSSSFIMGNADVVLYAIWTSNPTYTVSYNANGANSGNIPSDPNSYKQGDNVIVKGNVGGLARTGYTFDGWNTNSTGTGNQYAANSQFTMGTSNVNLWAKWKPVSYIVTFDDLSATTHVTPADITVTYPDTCIKNYPSAPAKIGFNFGGWFTAASGGGVRFTNTTKVTASMTVFANWIPYYNVSYLGNGNTTGSSPVDTTKYLRGQSTRVLGVNTLRKDGYTFANWNSMYNAKGKFYAQNDTLIIGSSTVTLHAAWRATINFDGQGATTGPSPATISIYHPDTLLSSMPTNPSRTGYAFAGWYTAVSGGTQFTATTKVTGNDTLYARWTINTYALSYNGNGSDGGTVPAGGTYNYNSTVSAAVNTFTRTGYRFTGWNTAANGSGTVYAAGTNITITGDITLYAQWSLVPTYTVTYNANGGTGTVPVNSKNYLSGDTIHVAGNSGSLTKTDSTFAGWSRAAGIGKVYNSGDTLTVGSSNINLFARWNKKVALAITAFSFSSPAATGVIDSTAKTVTINVPYGTVVTSLTPTITHNGASINPVSGAAVDFTNDVTYTITGADASTEVYTVAVHVAANPAKSITAFNFTTPTATGVINSTAHTITVNVPFGTDVTGLIPTITHSGASISPASGVAQNFTNEVTYTVTAADGSTQDYLVAVNVSSASNNANLSALDANAGTLSPAFAELTTSYTINVAHTVASIILTGTTAEAHATISGNNGVAQSLAFGENVITLSVTAQNGSTTKNYTVTVNRASEPVSFSGLEANGESGVTTTELTLTFDKDPTTLTIGDVAVSGATKGTLSGSGTTRTLGISAITAGDGGDVTVTITNPTGFTITPASMTVPVHFQL
jgi:uncharacterized repeat protein (TIGR02543 family)